MQAEQKIPDRFDVAVLMECRAGVTRWQPEVWAPVGLVAGAVARGPRAVPVPMPSRSGGARALWRGFVLTLHRDEAESYYYALLSPRPQAYVVMRSVGEPRPVPALVTLSFDEANAYAEGDDDVSPVPMPPELARWLEAFVIRHFVPEKRVKRKRKAWTENR